MTEADQSYQSRGVGYELFGGPDIRDCFSRREADILSIIDAVSDDELLNSTFDELVAKFTKDGQLEAPTLDLNDIHICERGQAKVDVSNDAYRLILDRSKPTLVDGQYVVIGFPVIGMSSLLEYRPVTYGFTNPNAAIRGDLVELYVEATPAIDPDVLKQEREKFTKFLVQAMNSVTQSVLAYNMQVESRIADKCKAKIAEANKRQQAIDSLGLPVRLAKSLPLQDQKKSEGKPLRAKGDTKNFAFDVFISHAWEDKAEVAEPLYKLLTKAGYKVWIDTVEMDIGDRLPRKIAEGLSNTRFGIVILSPSFVSKYWTQHELDGLFEKENAEGVKVILPVWHKMGKKDVQKYSPSLASIVAGTTDKGIEDLTKGLIRVFEKEKSGKNGTAGAVDRFKEEPAKVIETETVPAKSPSENTEDEDSIKLACDELLSYAAQNSNMLMTTISLSQPFGVAIGREYRDLEEVALYIEALKKILKNGILEGFFQRENKVYHLSYKGIKAAKALREPEISAATTDLQSACEELLTEALEQDNMLQTILGLSQPFGVARKRPYQDAEEMALYIEALKKLIKDGLVDGAFERAMKTYFLTHKGIQAAKALKKDPA